MSSLFSKEEIEEMKRLKKQYKEVEQLSNILEVNLKPLFDSSISATQYNRSITENRPGIRVVVKEEIPESRYQEVLDVVNTYITYEHSISFNPSLMNETKIDIDLKYLW